MATGATNITHGATGWEVQKFGDVAASVRAYMHNLNTNHQYEVMRELRENREPVTGVVLAHGLHAYPIRGADYIQELVSMINSNGLLRYDALNLNPWINCRENDFP